MNYTIWIVSPYSHSRCFEEVSQSLNAAFKDLGHNCEITTFLPLNRENVIVLGAHLLHPDDMLYLNNPTIWNLEQIPSEGDDRENTPLTSVYLEILKQATVWDYSQLNIETLKSLGIEAKLLEVGYMPTLTRIENSPVPDIDVLFIGSLNERRKHILEKITHAGVKVVHAFDCYGVKRDALIARAKIVANIHYYPAKIFEIVRCSYLMANRKFVISENGEDIDLEYPFIGCMPFCDYGEIVSTCLEYLRNTENREAAAQRSFEIFSKRCQVEFLRRVLQ